MECVIWARTWASCEHPAKSRCRWTLGTPLNDRFTSMSRPADLLGIAAATALSVAMGENMKQNMHFPFVYKAPGILLVAGRWPAGCCRQ